MSSSDDPFLRLLASLTGQTISFRCGSGGFEDALASYCFLDLCERHGIAVAGARSRGTVAHFRVAIDRAVDAGGGAEIVLPLSGPRSGAAADLARGDVSVFCCEPGGLRWAELAGVPHDRRWLCRELAFHLDFADLRFPSAAGEGTVRLAGGASAEDGDALAVILSGAGERWLSRDRCRDALQHVLGVLDPYAEVVTDSVDAAVFVAKLGRKAILRAPTEDGGLATASRFASEGLSVTVDPVPNRPHGADRHRPSAADRYGPRERETLLLEIAALRERRDAEVAAAVAMAEVDRVGDRLVRASAVERRVDAAERQAAEAVAAERARADAAERRAADAEAETARRERAVADAADRSARKQDADHQAQTAALEASLAAEEDRCRALERRLGEAQALLDRATALGVEADREVAALRAEAAATRGRLDTLLASSSWRATRPLRGLIHALRGPAGG